MNRISFLILLILLISKSISAQVNGGSQLRGTGKISGTVLDSLTSKGVEFATVAVLDPVTGKPFDGAVCDEKGKFIIPKLPNGKFTLSISFIGYTTRNVKFLLSERNNDVNLGSILISPSTEVLKEILVSGQKSLIEEKVDRTVYNAENDNTSKGGDASDVMRRVPMLSVDMDGNVSLRGNQNVRVLINNKPSTMVASSVADALKQIPADQIKSVEVITSPSAKYDAEGSAGIINIITKKNNLQGLTMNIDAGFGLRGSNLGLNGNYRKGKMGFSLGGWGRAGYNVTGSYLNNQLIGPVNNIQSASTRRSDIFGRYNFGWDYDINKNNSIAASVRYGLRDAFNYQDNLLTTSYLNSVLSSSSLRQVNVIDNSGTVDLNLDYTHLFKKPQQEFTILTLFSKNDRTNNFQNIIEDPNDLTILSKRRNENLSFNQEVTVQADYQTPIGQTQILEMGGKQILRSVSSDYNYFNAVGNGAYQPDLNTNLSNVFNYNQNVSAGYMSYTLNTGKAYSVKAGGRYEYTTINANFANATEINTDIPSYGVFVPSLNVSRKLSNGKTVKAAYNKRIQRPSIQFLNPNIQASNPLNVVIGNPNLNPEYTDNYELSYSTFVKGTTVNMSGFYRNTTGSIQSIREAVATGDTIKTRYANIGLEHAYGFNFFGNFRISSKFSLNGGTDVYYSVLDNNLPGADHIENSGWVYGGRIFGNYTLKNGWGLQVFSFYRGRQVQLQGYQGGFGMYNLNVRKDFNNKKGSIGFGLENFFAKSMKIRNEVKTPSITQKSVNVMNNISFRVNVSYRIGKMGFEEPRRRRKSINNDDLKDGGGDAGNQGGGGQAGGAPAAGPSSGRPQIPAQAPAPVKTKKKKEQQ